MKAPIKAAIDILGSQSELARRCGVSQASVWHWLNRMGRVPAEHAITIEVVTGGKVTRQQLRPDIYPEPTPPKRKRTSNGAEAMR